MSIEKNGLNIPFDKCGEKSVYNIIPADRVESYIKAAHSSGYGIGAIIIEGEPVDPIVCVFFDCQRPQTRYGRVFGIVKENQVRVEIRRPDKISTTVGHSPFWNALDELRNTDNAPLNH